MKDNIIIIFYYYYLFLLLFLLLVLLLSSSMLSIVWTPFYFHFFGTVNKVSAINVIFLIN